MNFLNWLVTSSADPQKYSLMVKGALSVAAAYLIQLLPVVCTLHIACINVEASLLNMAIATIATIVYAALTIVGSVSFLVGLGRKVWMGRWSAFVPAPDGLPVLPANATGSPEEDGAGVVG